MNDKMYFTLPEAARRLGRKYDQVRHIVLRRADFIPKRIGHVVLLTETQVRRVGKALDDTHGETALKYIIEENTT